MCISFVKIYHARAYSINSKDVIIYGGSGNYCAIIRSPITRKVETHIPPTQAKYSDPGVYHHHHHLHHCPHPHHRHYYLFGFEWDFPCKSQAFEHLVTVGGCLKIRRYGFARRSIVTEDGLWGYKWPVLFSVSSLCFLLVVWDVSSQLLLQLPCPARCHTSLLWWGQTLCPLGTIYPK